MKASKLIASAAAAFTVVGAIGLAYAQTETGEQNPPIVEGVSDPSLRSLKNMPAETAPMSDTTRAAPMDSAPMTPPAQTSMSTPMDSTSAAPAPAPADNYAATPAPAAPVAAPADTSTQPAAAPSANEPMTTERAPQADRN